jgi:hypothetical protein
VALGWSVRFSVPIVISPVPHSIIYLPGVKQWVFLRHKQKGAKPYPIKRSGLSNSNVLYPYSEGAGFVSQPGKRLPNLRLFMTFPTTSHG